MTKINISLNMIVGPIYEPFLVEAVESARPIVDEIILVDTYPGNNPNREAMESIYAANILELPRESLYKFSYSQARELARQASTGEWFMRLDADEVLPFSIIEELKNHTLTDSHSSVQVKFWHHFLHPDYYVDTSNDPKTILYRKDKCGVWVNDVHEECHVMSGTEIKAHWLKYNHYGYVRGQAEVWKRWKLYEELGGFYLRPNSTEPYVDTIDPNNSLSGMEDRLIHYEGTHPDIVVPKLLEMYPDLGTFPLDKQIEEAKNEKR